MKDLFLESKTTRRDSRGSGVLMISNGGTTNGHQTANAKNDAANGCQTKRWFRTKQAVGGNEADDGKNRKRIV